MQPIATEESAQETGLLEMVPIAPKFRSGAAQENEALEDLERRFQRIVRALTEFQKRYLMSKDLKTDITILTSEIYNATQDFETDIETARNDLEREIETRTNIEYARDLVDELPDVLGSGIDRLLDAPDIALRARFNELSKRMHLNEPLLAFVQPNGSRNIDPFAAFLDSVQNIATTVR